MGCFGQQNGCLQNAGALCTEVCLSLHFSLRIWCHICSDDVVTENLLACMASVAVTRDLHKIWQQLLNVKFHQGRATFMRLIQMEMQVCCSKFGTT
jgi:hypothetical protein